MEIEEALKELFCECGDNENHEPWCFSTPENIIRSLNRAKDEMSYSNYDNDKFDRAIKIVELFCQEHKIPMRREEDTDKEIRPEKAGELWKSDLITFYTYELAGELRFTYMDGRSFSIERAKDVIHNQGGWQRIDPPVEDDIEDIELPSRSEITMPDSDEFSVEISGHYLARVITIEPFSKTAGYWNGFLDVLRKCNIKMIFEIPKEDEIMTDYQCENCDYSVPEGHLIVSIGTQWKCPICEAWTEITRRSCPASASNASLEALKKLK